MSGRRSHHAMGRSAYKDIQRELFEHAISMGKLQHTAELKGQIAQFLHKHRGDDREPARL